MICKDKQPTVILPNIAPTIPARKRAIVIDTQEKRPLKFNKSKTKHLKHGDYSLEGYEDQAAIERKSMQDIASSICGTRRAIFEKNIKNAKKSLKFYGIVVEGNWADFSNPKKWYGRVAPKQVKGTITKWSAKYGMPVYFAGNKKGAAEITESVLKGYAYYNQTLPKTIPPVIPLK
ncbi:ERCC4 domain-containing protein [Nanoarchaeota archaeon]